MAISQQAAASNNVESENLIKIKSDSVELQELNPIKQQREQPDSNISQNSSPNSQKANIVAVDAELTDDDNKNEEEEQEEEEEKYQQYDQLNDGQQEPETEYYCICGKLLKFYPPSKHQESSQSNSNIKTPEAQTFQNAYRGFRKLLKDRLPSITRLDLDIDDEDDDDDDSKDSKDSKDNKENEENEENENKEISGISSESIHTSKGSKYSKDSKASKDNNYIEDAMIKQINLQKTESNKEGSKQSKQSVDDLHDINDKDINLALGALTEDFNVNNNNNNDDELLVHTDDSDIDDLDNKENDSRSLEEDSEVRRDAELQLLEMTGVEKEFQKTRDEYIKISCYSCECDMNDTQFKRYECEDKNCYKRKHINHHIQYCLQCYKQLKLMTSFTKQDEEVFFHDEGYEIRSETARTDGEPSMTDTETQTNTNTQTQTNQTQQSETEMSPPPNSDYTANRDFYKFQCKLKKMVIDHKDKIIKHNKKKKKENTENAENKEKEIEILKPTKAVYVYPSDDSNPDRVCYISVELNHLSISERYETGNAECDVQLTVKLYWMISERDYKKYNKLKRKNKKRNLSFNPKDIDFSFKPQINFYQAVGNRDIQQQQHIKLIDIKSFFGDDILKNLHILPLNGGKKKDFPWDNIRNLLFGYMAEITYYAEVKIFEPFEIENFPFDCQDIPIIIEPNNFHTLAPAYFNKKNSTFLTITGDATNLGRWSMENTISEFNNKRNNKSNILRIMLKLKRRSTPYLLEHLFLIAAVCFISLTAFTIDEIGPDIKHERLAIVLGLILTLIFIDLPAVPNVTLLHWYFYAAFGFLVFMAIHFALSTYYSPLMLKIQDIECYDDEDECKWYQTNNYNLLWFTFFALVYVIYHLIFVVVSVTKYTEENKKLQMNSIEVKEKVESQENHWKITTPSIFKEDENNRKKSYLRYLDTDLFAGYPTVEDEDDDGTVDQVKNIILQQHRHYNRSKSKMSEIMERLSIILLVTAAFVVLPSVCSILQFILIKSENCKYRGDIEINDITINGVRITEKEMLTMIILSGLQTVLCLLLILFWFGCCNMIKLFVYALPIAILVALTNYIFAVRSFAMYFYNNITCDTSANHNGYLQDVLYWLFLIWIVIYAIMFGLSYTKIAFPQQFVEKKGMNLTKDSKVEMLQFFKQKMKNDIKPKYQYFNFKMVTTSIPIIIQYPATIILLILVMNKSCNNNNEINIEQSIALIVLSLIFHGIRALLQGKNSFFYYFTYYMFGNIAINILTMQGFVFVDRYFDDDIQCKEKSNLYNSLWYFMVLWVLYDNISIIGVIFEFGLNYKKIHFQTLPFLSVLIMGSILIFQLPACIGQLYVVLRYDINSAINLSANAAISFIIIIWIQIVIYRFMADSKTLRDFTIFPMYIFLFVIYVISIQSLVFWISIDDTTVASVIFCIILSIGIIYDTFLLLAPTFILPLAAWTFYGKHRGNGMVRSMAIQTLVFLFIQIPSCMFQLVAIWKGDIKTISAGEGMTLLLLTWISLIIGFLYTYIYFDTDPKVQEKMYPKLELKPLKIYIKYVLYCISLVVWCIIIHCFSFWSKNERLGTYTWWFLLLWIIYMAILSISPAIRFMWLMFCGQGRLERWINNVYIFVTVFSYAFIQLPASIIQLTMIEFSQCIDHIGHSLDNNIVESLCILIFTLIQLILFYAICDIIGWGDESDKTQEFKRKSRYQDTIIETRVTGNYNFNRHNNNDWQDLGFNSKEEYNKAVREKKKEIKNKKRRQQFKKYYGSIFYVGFVVICIIQFGLAIHSYTYWDKTNKQIDCNDNIGKTILYILFLGWIIIYAAAPIGVLALWVLRTGMEWNDKRKDKDKDEKTNDDDDNDNNEQEYIANV